MASLHALSAFTSVASPLVRGKSTTTRAQLNVARVHARCTGLSTTARFNGSRALSTSSRNARRLTVRAADDDATIVSPFVSDDKAANTRKKYDELTKDNVEEVLDTIRPYLIADGGNIEVVTIDPAGIVSLKLQGACGSCESSQATMKNGVEKILFESFGDLLKTVQEVRDGIPLATVNYVNQFLDKLRPAIANYGGSVECTSVEDGVANIKYKGPEMIAAGIRDAVKERFEDLENVVVLILPSEEQAEEQK
uniref:NIF system FeS cluster assembly NifU C-terminal domain-containing protein n=1 Tax=Pyramimonas obovata TaxID=1411642 RepID=A0A7S0WI97_9CHLO|mmetsp:Transcript_26602/g.57888  ORF Transcript_26602/g.57888 Transcript_26602/m.57888 type:complete len:252 (+) Transcript_26602:289-1044(+)|eukprot:CAMPEP_0118926074 /NCGR_PEP_ID=MMETSP1169-20130426/3860_1 /TAXON_ID=36882 /ORGANISM="Pyramimonas obovata, Strain CCMP722" /LENGTH=251 /DNA_ID=CAMNT_0006867551 /DNA_START=281 /DNA_END=1036 /DNA_ORIENTATION=-